MKIFVYGTLKYGYFNYERFLDGFVTSVEEVTVDGYTLWGSGFPIAVPTRGSLVRGELMEIVDDVADEVLAYLDVLEDHPRSYERSEVTVKKSDGSTDTALMYIWKHEPWTPHVGEVWESERDQVWLDD